MSRTQNINETIAILGNYLPTAGFPSLDGDKLQELYTAIEGSGKSEKEHLASQLGFSIRKRSVSKDKAPIDLDKPHKPPRKTGYSIFPGDSEKYNAQVDALANTINDSGETITKRKAKNAIWKSLSEEDKDPFNQAANSANRENGLEEKKTPSPKGPKPTLAQIRAELEKAHEQINQLRSINNDEEPSINDEEPSINDEERTLSPPVQMPTALELANDSDSDDDDYNHTQWSVSLVTDSDETGPKADFIAWLISERPLEFGPTHRNTLFNESEVKQFKTDFDFKTKKKDPTNPWYDFIKINSTE